MFSTGGKTLSLNARGVVAITAADVDISAFGDGATFSIEASPAFRLERADAPGLAIDAFSQADVENLAVRVVSLNETSSAFTLFVADNGSVVEEISLSVTRPAPAAPISLANLDGDNGFKVNGVGLIDQLGSGVSGRGDFNGDGFDDVLIGAENSGPGEFLQGTGDVFIIFGAKNGFNLIRDFQNGADKIKGAASSFDQLRISDSQGEAIVKFGRTTLQLDGTRASQLDAFDFIFDRRAATKPEEEREAFSAALQFLDDIL